MEALFERDLYAVITYNPYSQTQKPLTEFQKELRGEIIVYAIKSKMPIPKVLKEEVEQLISEKGLLEVPQFY